MYGKRAHSTQNLDRERKTLTFSRDQLHKICGFFETNKLFLYLKIVYFIHCEH